MAGQQNVIDALAARYSKEKLPKVTDLNNVVKQYDQGMKLVDIWSKDSKRLAEKYKKAMRAGSKDIRAMKELAIDINLYKKDLKKINDTFHGMVTKVPMFKPAIESEYKKEKTALEVRADIKMEKLQKEIIATRQKLQKDLRALEEQRAGSIAVVDKISADAMRVSMEAGRELAAAADLARRVKQAVESGGIQMVHERPEDEVLFQVANLK